MSTIRTNILGVKIIKGIKNVSRKVITLFGEKYGIILFGNMYWEGVLTI